MASFEETALVLQEVAQIFSQDDDAQSIREILAIQREIAALREEQQKRLEQMAEEWERNEQEAQENFVHIEAKENFEQVVETLESDKFRIAKSINNAEGTRQTLERSLNALHAQKALLERVDALVQRLDDVERRLAKQLRSDPSATSLVNDDAIRAQTAELSVLIKDVEGHKAMADEAQRLKHLRARLASADTLKEELIHVRRSLEVGSFVQFYQWVAPIKWEIGAPGVCKGTMRAPPNRPHREPYEFSIDVTRYSPAFIANHLWDMMDAC